jgi:hypothetical protein
MGAIEGLAPDDRDRGGVCGAWSVRQILIHLGSYEEVLADVFAALGGTADTPTLDQFRASPDFNDAEVAARDAGRRGSPWRTTSMPTNGRWCHWRRCPTSCSVALGRSVVRRRSTRWTT